MFALAGVARTATSVDVLVRRVIRLPVQEYVQQLTYHLEVSTRAINGLIAEEPNNPYFYEVRGQIYVSLAKPGLAIPDYQKSVSLRPRAPQLRTALATAQLATDDPAMAAPALPRVGLSACP